MLCDSLLMISVMVKCGCKAKERLELLFRLCFSYFIFLQRRKVHGNVAG